MGNLIQPVILRFLTYVLSSLILLLPAWAAGLVTLDTTHGTVSLSLVTAASLVAAAVFGSAGIAAKWGVKVDPGAVSGLLTRLATYAAAPALAALPASAAGFVSFDQATGLISVSYGALAGIGAAAIGGSSAVFAKWGVKS